MYFYLGLAKLLPLSFVLKLMERGEALSQSRYQYISTVLPEAKSILREEQEHEEDLLNLIEEPILNYLRSMVLGMNDAIIEMLGVLSGLTNAISDNTKVALLAFITGFAASLSMSAAEYLSTRHEPEHQDSSKRRTPLKAAIFTGTAYITVVLVLILPFLLNLFPPVVTLVFSVLLAVAIVLLFSFFTSVLMDRPLWKQFFETSAIIGTVIILSGIAGWTIKKLLNVQI